MKKLTLILLAFMLIVGCRAKTNLKNKDIYQSKVEKVVEVETQITKEVKKDSTISTREKQKEDNTNTGIKVVFDPKKNDSLEVTHILGKDSLKLKISGNGIVTLDYRKETKEIEKVTTEIFGSETLFKMDSTLSNKVLEEVNSKAVIQDKKTKNTGLDLGMYIIIGICALVLMSLWFLWNKFGGSIVEWYNKRKNK